MLEEDTSQKQLAGKMRRGDLSIFVTSRAQDWSLRSWQAWLGYRSEGAALLLESKQAGNLGADGVT